MLNQRLEKAEQDKDVALADKEKHIVRVEKQKFASDLVNKSIESHLLRKSSGIGYNDVAPPVKSAFAPPTKELSIISEIDCKPVGESSVVSNDTPKVEKKYLDAPIIEDWVSDSKEEQFESTQMIKKKEIPKSVESKV